MKRVFHYTTIIVAAILLLSSTSCIENKGVEKRRNIAVTIQPLKYIVEQITDNDFEVEVILPKGASPETYEPTPKQIIRLNETQMIFSTGLIDFENALLDRIGNKRAVINLSEGIELIEGSCSHNHSGADSHNHTQTTHSAHKNPHIHGIDPHIWTSPRELKTMVQTAHRAIMSHYPDSTKYHDAYEKLMVELDNLDRKCGELCRNSNVEAFVVYHPALTYYARAYGIEQIAIENDGKEPSAKHLAKIIEQAKAHNVKCILYQMQYPRSVVEVVAKDMGVECVVFDPLEEDLTENILNITHTISGTKR